MRSRSKLILSAARCTVGLLNKQDVDWDELDGDCYFPPDGLLPTGMFGSEKTSQVLWP